MLPEFDEQGNLPPGIHLCTLEEVADKFGHGSPEREVETKELVRFIQWAQQANIRRLLVDGSYVTTAISPNDVDIVVLPGDGYPSQAGPARTLAEQWPFLHVMLATDEADFERWARIDFGIDHWGNTRGILEINL